jgi:hypothetical protein
LRLAQLGSVGTVSFGYSSFSKSFSAFLCFGAFNFFSTIARSGGGRPMPSLARLRASVATLNFDFFFFDGMCERPEGNLSHLAKDCARAGVATDRKTHDELKAIRRGYRWLRW